MPGTSTSPSTQGSGGANRKPKLTRAYAPKVRTGCLTWTRRKKCDEEKPTCRRCRDGGWKCDGYAPTSAPSQPATSRSSSPSPSPASCASTGTAIGNAGTGRNIISKSNRRMLAIRPSPCARILLPRTRQPGRGNPLLPGPTPSLFAPLIPGDNPLEHRFLHHFFNHTLGDIVLSPGPDDFWRRTLPMLSQTEPLIRHAITALGATHWLFLGNEYITPSQAASYVTLQNQEYNQAISHLMPLMSSNEESKIPLILTCCLLFVFLEVLRGSPDEAIHHLASGSRLLTSLSQTYNSQSSTLDEETLREIACLFRGIGAEVTFFTESRLLSDMGSYAFPLSQEIEQPFESVEDVDDELSKIEMQLFDVEWTDDRDKSYIHRHDIDNLSPEQLAHREQDRATWRTIRVNFDRWEKRFDRTLLALTPEEKESVLVLKLQLQRRLWHEMTDGDDTEENYWDEDDISITVEDANSILDDVERLLLMSPATTRTFTLRADFVPALTVIYGGCTDVAVRRRAIGLLRLRRRREIVWDSEDVARFLEADLESCLAGRKAVDMLPEMGPCSDKSALLVYRPRGDVVTGGNSSRQTPPPESSNT